MSPNEDDRVRICHDCVGDRFLSAQVKAEGLPSLCTHCGETEEEAVTLDDLADVIHPVLQEEFELARDDPTRYGYPSIGEDLWDGTSEPVADVIASMACVDDEIAEALRQLLSGRHAYPAIRDGEDDPYGPDARYAERGPDTWAFRESWVEFRRDIRSRARFFSTYSEEALGKIFGDLGAHRALGDRRVIRVVGPDDDDRFFWRARKAQSTAELETILKSPSRELGPPPSRLAKGGRMNAPGIPVFYGALDEGTCLAEARAPVGSDVVVARFELLRPVRLLDFDALAEVYDEGSHFDPEYSVRRGRWAFLRQFVREVSMPVMPQDEAFEYLPTQAVAEYLAHKAEPRVDGIVFRSTQTGQAGHNVVLFNHASGVLRSDLPDGAEVSVFFHSPHPEDEEEDDLGYISVSEAVPSPPAGNDPVAAALPSSGSFVSAVFSTPLWDDFESLEFEDPAADEHATLRLDADSVVVLRIRGVQYQSSRQEVIRTKSTKAEGLGD